MVSLLKIESEKKNSIIYLSPSNKTTYDFFKKKQSLILKNNFVDKVVIRYRSTKEDHLGINYLKDILYYKKYINESFHLYTFAWNPFSLFISSNYLFKKATEVDLIEDAKMVYQYPEDNRLKKFIRKNIYRINYNFHSSNKLRQIEVTYPDKFNTFFSSNVSELNLEKLKDKLSPKQKENFLKVFDFSFEKNTVDKRTVLILTQPFSEVGYMKESEKQKIYELLVEYFIQLDYEIFLKKHPLDNTIYNFENKVYLIEKYIPAEILSFSNIIFTRAVSISTSAIEGITAHKKENLAPNFFENPSFNTVLQIIKDYRGMTDDR